MKKIITTILIICFAALYKAQNCQPDKWMGNLNTVIGNKPLSSLVLPGAYKAGLHEITGSTAIPEKCSTQSQDTTVYGLLSRGARYLDMTLICRYDSIWYLGTYHYSFLFGLQFAVGQSLNSALHDLTKFMNEPLHTKEIIVINISGYADSKRLAKPAIPYGDINPLKKEQLLKKLSVTLGNYLYKDKLTHTLTVNQVLSSVQKKQGVNKKTAALILSFSDADDRQLKTEGIHRADSCGSKAGMPVKTLFYRTAVADELKNQWPGWGKAGSGDCFTVMQWLLTWRSIDNKCNRQLALTANTMLEDLLVTKKVAFYPQVICVFFFSESLTRTLFQLNAKPRLQIK